MTLKEIVDNAKNFDSSPQTDKIKLFGWYLHTHQKKVRFDTAALRACYDELQLKDPVSFSPFFKSLEAQKALHKDRAGYYLDRKVMEAMNSRSATGSPTASVSQLLLALPGRLTDTAEQSFIEEAITCIRAKAPRAAIVLGWCAVIDRMRRKIEALGFGTFNAASTKIKNQTTGKFKHWTKGVQANSPSDLLAIFDNDLITVLVGMELLDDNESKRLGTLFQWRCDSAHPSAAPIGEAHVVSFFTDVVDLVLANPKFAL